MAKRTSPAAEPAGRESEVDTSPEYMLIGFLLDAPMYGYQLYHVLHKELGASWHVSLTHIYNVLKRMERGGLIVGKIQSKTIPAQRVFHVTPAGRRAFETWLNKPCRPSAKTIRLEFMPRLYFLLQRDASAARALLLEQKACIDRELSASKGSDAHQRETDSDFARLSDGLQRTQLEAARKWLDSCDGVLQVVAVKHTKSRL
jgi:PadR family transcriptional regulator, regulatory protein AphA